MDSAGSRSRFHCWIGSLRVRSDGVANSNGYADAGSPDGSADGDSHARADYRPNAGGSNGYADPRGSNARGYPHGYSGSYAVSDCGEYTDADCRTYA